MVLDHHLGCCSYRHPSSDSVLADTNAAVDRSYSILSSIYPMNRSSAALMTTCLMVSLFGFGCVTPWSHDALPPSAATPSFGGLSSKETAARVRFMANDSFEMRQTLFGFGAFLADVTGSTKGIRYVTITRYVPKEIAALKWTTVEERETDASKKRRADYDAEIAKKTFAIGEKMPLPPESEMEKQTAEGTLTNINLKNSHTLMLPFYWHAGDTVITQGDKSAMWLSDDAFLELEGTRQTVLNFGVLDEIANKVSQNINQLKSALARLRRQADEEGKNKDLTLLKAEPDFVDWSLKVNGQDVTVSAIRAKNWFGEIVVLNNRQNPLVLKLTLNPLLAGASIFNRQEGWSHIFGFEVTNLLLQANGT